MDSVTPSSFGELLRTLRLRQRFTQQQVAAKLDMHRNAIGAWEQGSVLPKSKGMVLELARVLRLNDQETRQLLEASLTALAPYWSVPYLHNPFFTGREEILEELHRRLSPDQAIALTQSHAMYGLGGIGKTQLAIEYAYRYALAYSAVFWIGAETVESIIAGFLSLAEVLQLPVRHEADQQRVVAAAHRWLSTHKGWLLIWDNVEALELLSRFLPMAPQGTILMTTRMQGLGTLAQGLELQTMEPEEGMLLLLRRAKVLGPLAGKEQLDQFAISRSAEYAAARELVIVMDGLPLVLDQAGAYIEEAGCSLADYLNLYHTKRAALLQRRGDIVIDHPSSVVTTWFFSFEKIERQSAAAADLLRLCAFLSPDTIPEEIFTQGAASLGQYLGPVAADIFLLNDAIRSISAYSLLRRNAEEHTLSIHRLVQAVLRDNMDEFTTHRWMERTIEAVNAAFPEGEEVTTWPQCERCLSHAQICKGFMDAGVRSPNAARLLHETGSYLLERGRYTEAEAFLLQALTMKEQQSGPDCSEVAVILDRLATVYWQQGTYERAEPLFQRALSLRLRLFGPQHPETADSMNNLGVLYWQQSKYEQAEPLYREALRIFEQQLGPEHHLTIASMNNLASLYGDQGKYELTEPLLLEVLVTCEQKRGLRHPATATALNNLADLYARVGKYEQAEPLFQRALSIREEQLGVNHPDIASILNNMAKLYLWQGKHEQAKPLLQRALGIREEQLGPHHPGVAMILHKLALLYKEEGKYGQAEVLLQRALTIREQSLGLDHLNTARTLADLALLYQKQGKHEQAEPLLQRACAIFEQRLGQEHPETVKARNEYRNFLDQKSRGVETPGEEQQEDRMFVTVPSPERGAGVILQQETDPFAAFLITCCELHPHAWCRSAEIWRAYEHWVEVQQERFPLSRRAFVAQLKAHGCRPDRTNTARIWRGIALANPKGDGT